MIQYKLIFHKKVEDDLKKLDTSILNLFEKKLKQVLIDPSLGVDLGSKLGINLCGFKKIYFANKKYRIVYKVLKEEITVYIISIGKREDMKVYKDAYKRLNDK
ncbi:MAG: type II toxin-antitoxin system RelE/ParE family toxin [Candidatus Gracilibacteria bacterium]|nr:type II toxin-antitoxin system RelE/ParE family toxin [Candidatus Gracilibacteria bacterium]